MLPLPSSNFHQLTGLGSALTVEQKLKRREIDRINRSAAGFI
jgi:hypothetical protein